MGRNGGGNVGYNHIHQIENALFSGIFLEFCRRTPTCLWALRVEHAVANFVTKLAHRGPTIRPRPPGPRRRSPPRSRSRPCPPRPTTLQAAALRSLGSRAILVRRPVRYRRATNARFRAFATGGSAQARRSAPRPLRWSLLTRGPRTFP